MDFFWISLFFSIFLLCGVVVVVTLFLCRIALRHSYGLSKKGVRLMFSVCVLALALRLWGVPIEHRVYYDEFHYLSTAQNIFFNGINATTVKGSRWIVEVPGKTTRPAGFGLLLVLFYSLTGLDVRTAPFVMNIILGILSVALVYRIAWRLFEDTIIAWWSAVFLAFSPVHILCSTCASADVAGFFFFLLAIMFLAEWSRILVERRKGGQGISGRLVLYAAIFSGCYGIYVKPEYIVLFVAWFATFFVLFVPINGIDRKAFLDFIFIPGCLLLPVFLLMPTMIGIESRYGRFFSWEYIQRFSLGNVGYLFNINKTNLVMTYSALLSVGTIIYRWNDRFLKWLVILFCLGFFAMSGYFAGDLPNSSLGRHLFLLLLPFVLLAGDGMRILLGKFFRFRLLVGGGLFLIVGMATIYALGTNVNYVCLNKTRGIRIQLNRNRDYWFVHWHDRKMFKLAEQIIPDDAYIVYDDPTYFTTMTSRRSLSWNRFSMGDYPCKIALLRGLSWANEEKCKTVNALKMYKCRELVTTSWKAQTGPLAIDLCERKR